MAETKKAKPKKSSRKASGSGSKPKSSKANGAAASKASGAASSNGGGAAHAIAPVAQKVVLPLVAAGAAVAGAAVVVSKNGRKRKVLGVSLPKRSKLPLPKGKEIRGDVRKAAGAMTEAAKQADRFGQRVSKVASSVQTVGETANEAAKKH